MKIVVLAFVLLPAPLLAQGGPLAGQNPLAELKQEVTRVLTEAKAPFTDDQEKAIALMMEDRRQASEGLFGNLMDFRAGPTQRQDEDRLRSAIEWLRTEFLAQLQNYLTPPQLDVWNRFRQAREAEESTAAGQGGRQNTRQEQTQYVRINNNAFTAEDAQYRNNGGFGFGNNNQNNQNNNNQNRNNQNNNNNQNRNNQGGNQGGQVNTEIIQRGGVGAYFVNAQVTFRDDALNARNPFAHNKPPYHEHVSNFDFGGPLIPRRLTAAGFFSHNRAENADTIHATLPEGPFDLGIVRPTTNRTLRTRGTYQIVDSHSLTYNVGHRGERRRNQGVGGFTLPDRAWNATDSNWNAELRQFSAFSSTSLFESRVNVSSNTVEEIPFSQAPQINVLDTVRSGGAQNGSDETRRNYDFGMLYTRLGNKVTVKTGVDGVYRGIQALNEENFGGTFTFSSLTEYVAGRSLNYRVVRGTPLTEITQLELAGFYQSDIKVNSRATIMAGVRYDVQTNIGDRNNIAPRIALAYAPGPSTVIRVGTGLFHRPIQVNVLQTQRRLDGAHQSELVIDKASYPDPFQAGTIRNTPPSVQVLDPDLAQARTFAVHVSVERTFLRTLLLIASYDRTREVERVRYRDLNAPVDVTQPFPTACSPATPADLCVRPLADRGNLTNLESSGDGLNNVFRLSYRHRFSIFNISSTYTVQRNYDSVAPGNPQPPANSYDLAAEWSRNPAPVHQLDTSVNTRLPMGIFLTGRFTSNSGRAYTITTGKDDNRDTQTNDRPAGVGKYSERAPAYYSTDFNISKAIFLRSAPASGGARTNVNVFVNLTNAFNWTNLGQPSGVMTSSNFGKSTSAVNPREVEAGFRFQF
ncbi:MAG TPA: hypothetical protein VGJ39_10415 [Vicinamibacterales bacterium]